MNNIKRKDIQNWFMNNIKRKDVENWFLAKAYNERFLLQAELLEAMVATFIWVYEDELQGEVELDVEFCLNHYDKINETACFIQEPLGIAWDSLHLAWDIAIESHEGNADDCDCDQIDMSDYIG